MLNLTGFEIVTTLQMVRQVGAPLGLVLEGPEDHALLSSEVNSASLSLIVAGSKTACIDACESAEKLGHDWIRVLTDRDFDVFFDWEKDLPPALVQTESYDLQTDYVRTHTRIIDQIVFDYLPADAATRLRDAHPDGPVSIIMYCAALIGKLRFAVIKSGFTGLSVRNWDASGVVRACNRGDELHWLLGRINSRLKGAAMEASELRELLSTVPADIDDWEFVSGHDLVAVLSDLIDEYGRTKAPHREVDRALRAAARSRLRDVVPLRSLADWSVKKGYVFWETAA